MLKAMTRFTFGLPLAAGVLALVAALLFARSVIGADQGTPEMQQIASAIREGAQAFMGRQYKTIAIMAVVLAGVLYAGYLAYPLTAPLASKVVISFLVGAACSGFLGLYGHVRLDPRQSAHGRGGAHQPFRRAQAGAARRRGHRPHRRGPGAAGHQPALPALWRNGAHPEAVPYQLVGFGFGASLVALFAQLGGGIYTKAADVGADLVGKVEAGIPEDDPRNPAVIADLVGDNVGDCAGRGADCFESSAAESVGAMILGAALFPVFGIKGILFPLIVHAINIVASIIGVSSVHSKETDDPMHSLNRGFYITSFLALMGFAAGVHFLLQDRWWLLAAGVVGIVTSFLFVSITEYYTETRFRPGAVDCQGLPDGPGDQHHHRPGRGHGDARAAGVVISGALLLSYYFGVRGLEDAPGSPTTPRAFTARRSPPWACSRARPTFWPWTPSARSPTTPAASRR
jgi:K(+)-stimulated pyrophosphate-energized sodium pump